LPKPAIKTLKSCLIKSIKRNKLPRSIADEVMSDNILTQYQSYGVYNPEIMSEIEGSIRLNNFATQN